ncbi:hypothetical protein LV716_11040 [Flagellimonas sp. HMM57]|uniref:hypothetical protein n=1 Tax=unclassified Flagellimonas TaxID=2644544 RepID=UPI001F0A0903|nr:MULTISPECIES: hypothetical protein [unclassified Flagellimonas]UII74799.1 hypothetical protein LV716_11040 [Flagellimonas sp. HMM57]
MNKVILFTTLTGITLWTNYTFAQSEGLTSSPYSLYGLGVINQTSIGRSNGMGYTGIGLKTETEINNLNSSNYALTPQNSFFYDVGVRGQYDYISNEMSDDGKTTLNFSNLAFAFRITEGLGAGITMVPYSDVGYSLIGLQTNIEGSSETFESSVTGLGGLSDLRLNIGYSVIEKLRLGVSTSFLFGNIEENEAFIINNSAFQLTETTNYSGIRLGLGIQYDITDKFTLGSTVQFPTSLNGNLKRSVLKTLDASEITVEDEEADTAADFKMPLEFGLGVSGTILNSFILSADYKKNYWSSTGQQENIGEYADQDIYAFGLEYAKNRSSYKYAERIRFRAGFNYDNGYLAINDTKIDGYSITGGIGLPIERDNNSMLNLSYGYGSKGQVQNILVKENYHIVTLNMSLEDLWFRKRKIN